MWHLFHRPLCLVIFFALFCFIFFFLCFCLLQWVEIFDKCQFSPTFPRKCAYKTYIYIRNVKESRSEKSRIDNSSATQALSVLKSIVLSPGQSTSNPKVQGDYAMLASPTLTGNYTSLYLTSNTIPSCIFKLLLIQLEI